MKILVTGAAGFIGSHVCERLLDEGHDIVGLDNFDDFYDPRIKETNIQSSSASARFRLVRGDLLDAGLLDTILASGIDRVVHLAARAGVRPSIERPLLYYRNNVEGTLSLLEAIRKRGLRKLVLASSSSVYGNNQKIPYSEKDPVDHCISPYAATKKACELLAHTYHHLYGMDIFCLRFFTVYGPRQRPEMAIHAFTRAIANGEAVSVFGDGSSRRDYTYISDIVDGVSLALAKLQGFEIINLGESRTVALADVIRLIEANLGRPARLEFRPTQAGDVHQTWADVTKAETMLGYRPRVSIEEGVREFVSWYRRNK